MMLDCKHASRLVSQSQERRLSLREWVGLKLHLGICDACRNFSRQLGLLREAIRRVMSRMENDDAIQLSDEARKRIAHTLHEHE